MAKFLTKPVAVEAGQWWPGKELPGVLVGKTWRCDAHGPRVDDDPYVEAGDGRRFYLDPGDWVVAELDGNGHVACKPDVFRQYYSPAG